MGKTCQFQRDHEPHHGGWHGLTEAGAMRQHDISLQGPKVRGLDSDARELPEAGVDAVYRLAAIHNPADRSRALGNSWRALVIQYGVRPLINRAPFAERHLARLQYDPLHCPLQTLACSRLRPIQ